jgi:hypothetical protein
MTSTNENHAVVAVYDTHAEADAAINALAKGGFDMKRLSVIGRDFYAEDKVIGYYNTGDRVKFWGTRGAWGGIWEQLFGSAFLAVPGFGLVAMAGPLVGWIATALESAPIGGGLNALGAAFYSVGVPRDSILRYELALKANRFLVIAHGTASEAAKARDIIHSETSATEFEAHHAVTVTAMAAR